MGLLFGVPGSESPHLDRAVISELKSSTSQNTFG